jgi:hypothetical protein
MSPVSACRWAFAATWLLAACGGETDRDDARPAAGSGGAPSTGGGGAGGLAAGGTAAGGVGAGGAGTGGAAGAPVCGVDTQLLTLRFYNNSDQTLYLHQSCLLDFRLQSCSETCADVTMQPFCSQDCADPFAGCVVCGACLNEGLAVLPGESVDQDWQGCLFDMGMKQGCSCHIPRAAPSGTYRVLVPVFESSDAALVGMALREVELYFSVPWPTNIVEVLLVPP